MNKEEMIENAKKTISDYNEVGNMFKELEDEHYCMQQYYEAKLEIIMKNFMEKYGKWDEDTKALVLSEESFETLKDQFPEDIGLFCS